MNESEFKSLFDEHYNDLCKIVMPIVKDKIIAENVVQDVFVKLWIRKDNVKINSSPKGHFQF